MNTKIILIGMPGSGKTSFGKKLSEKLNMQFIDADDYLEGKENKTIKDIFKNEGEEKFRKYENKYLKELIQLANPIVISTGGGVIKLKENRDILQQNKWVVFIDREVDDIFLDIDSETRPLLSKEKEKLYNLYNERYDYYREVADLIVLNNKNFKTVLETIEKEIKEVMENNRSVGN